MNVEDVHAYDLNSPTYANPAMPVQTRAIEHQIQNAATWAVAAGYIGKFIFKIPCNHCGRVLKMTKPEFSACSFFIFKHTAHDPRQIERERVGVRKREAFSMILRLSSLQIFFLYLSWRFFHSPPATVLSPDPRGSD